MLEWVTWNVSWWGSQKNTDGFNGKLHPTWRCFHEVKRPSLGLKHQVLMYPLVIKHGSGKSPTNGGSNRKITYQRSILNCHVWLPEGIQLWLKLLCLNWGIPSIDGSEWWSPVMGEDDFSSVNAGGYWRLKCALENLGDTCVTYLSLLLHVPRSQSFTHRKNFWKRKKKRTDQWSTSWNLSFFESGWKW